MSIMQQEITPDKVADEECRVCDSCIQVIDEKLAEGLQKRFGKSSPGDNQQDSASTEEGEEQEASFVSQQKPLAPDANSTRAILTTGRYRCVSAVANRNLGR